MRVPVGTVAPAGSTRDGARASTAARSDGGRVFAGRWPGASAPAHAGLRQTTRRRLCRRGLSSEVTRQHSATFCALETSHRVWATLKGRDR